MIPYVTLGALRQFLSLEDDETSDDAALVVFLLQSRRMIDAATKREFVPSRRTLYFNHPSNNVICLPPHDLLEVCNLYDYNGASSIASSSHYLMSGDDHNLSPYSFIELASTCSFSYTSDPRKSVQVDGYWGYHEDYSNSAWELIGASLSGSVSSAVTIFQGGASDLPDEWGIPSRINLGHLLRIDDELVYVKGSGGASDTFVVKRGVNGTTATSHASGVSIERYQVEPDVSQASLWLAAYLYHESKSPYTGKVIFPQFGNIQMPPELPEKVRETIDRVKRKDIFAVL